MKTDFRGEYQAQLDSPGAKKKVEMKSTQVNKKLQLTMNETETKFC